MIPMNSEWLNSVTAKSRIMKGKVELFNSGSTEPSFTFLPTDKLVSIQLERTPGEGKFFGFVLTQKITIKIVDINNAVSINKGDLLKVYFGVSNDETITWCDNPHFYVEDVVSDELTKIKTITAYDILYKTSKSLFNEIEYSYPINIKSIAETICNYFGVSCEWITPTAEPVNIEYTEDNAPNLEGTESLRDVLAAIAEATGTICFVRNSGNVVAFKQPSSNAALDISKADYFSLKKGGSAALTQITSVTELGDNITTGTEGGINQIMRNNPFIENREDIADILAQLLICLNDVVITEYDIKWRGNPQLEVGDCVSIAEKDNTTFKVFYNDETISYTGGLYATSKAALVKQDNPHTNPSSLGETLKLTYARVDKIDKEITLVASENKANKETLAAIEINTGSISQVVSEIKEKQDDMEEDINGELKTLKDRVAQTITKDELKIEVEKILNEEGVDKVVTSTGFTFNDDGLNISKTNSQMTTQITEDGMIVKRDGTEVLIANNEGVKAQDLHAETYLIIGKNSRFEDYEKNGEARTGCFWIGGNN